MTRNEIEQKRKENFDKIEALKRENIELAKQAFLLSDEVQQFTEEIEAHPKSKYQRKPNYLDGKLVGRIHWKVASQLKSNVLKLSGLTVSGFKLAVNTSIYTKFFKDVNEDSCRISEKRVQDYILNIPSKMSFSYKNQVINAIKLYFQVIENRKLNEVVLPRTWYYSENCQYVDYLK